MATARPTEDVVIADSVANRQPVRHYYGAAIGTEVDPFRRRAVVYESALERRWLKVLMASPQVAEIREQQVLEIPMADGRRVKHCFDVVVFWAYGTVTAYACKYEEDIRPELVEVLRRAADTVGDAFADEYSILSEVGLTPRRVLNASRIIDCAKDFDLPAQDAIRRALPALGSRVRLAELDAIVGDGVRGSRAGIAMIQQGVFGLGPGDRIGFITGLRNLFTK